MSKWRFLLAAGAALTLSSPALASTTFFTQHHQQADTHPTDPEPDAEATGRITAIDADARSITLSDGHHFKIPAWINFGQLQQGAMVSVVYTPNPHRGTAAVKTISII